MTVSTSVRKQDFAGGQGTLTYTFYSIPDHPEHIKVTLKEIATGDETELTYGDDYTVAQETDGVGGVVTVSPTYSTAYTQTVWRDTTKTQESDYDDYNQFPADTLEKDLDRLMCLTQEISEEVERSIRNPITNPSSVTLAQIAAYATTCSTQAAAAAVSATTASTQATAAAASAVAAAASAAAVNLPTFATGDASKYLRVNAGEDGYDHVDLTESLFQSGMILMWSGAVSAIPSGWALCDGSNGTPDLTDRFVIHADADAAGTRNVGATGGTMSLVGSSGSLTLSAAQSGVPAHTHSFIAPVNSGGSPGGPDGDGSSRKTETTGANSAAAASEGHQHDLSAIASIPKFYALAYIMKT